MKMRKDFGNQHLKTDKNEMKDERT